MLYPTLLNRYVAIDNCHRKVYQGIKDHLGNICAVVRSSDNTPVQRTTYYASGVPMAENLGPDVPPSLYYAMGVQYTENFGRDAQPYLYNGKEFIEAYGLNEYDSQARMYYAPIMRTTTMDPHAENNYHQSPYSWCGNNPIAIIDLDGKDWYQNSQTLFYTWFHGGRQEHYGYFYVGNKGCLLGELEPLLDKVLQDNKLESLYSEGFTFDITPIDKGAMIGSKDRDWDFLDEFVFNEGPEFSVLLGDHPYTQQMMNDAKVKEGQKRVREEQSFVDAGQSDWGLFNVINPHNWKMAPQFIGTYTYYGTPSADGLHINNVIYDYKNVRSLFLHIPNNSWNKRRREYKQRFGNTYQFYIWQSPK